MAVHKLYLDTENNCLVRSSGKIEIVELRETNNLKHIANVDGWNVTFQSGSDLKCYNTQEYKKMLQSKVKSKIPKKPKVD